MSLKQMAMLTVTVVALVVIVTLMKVGLPGSGRGNPGPKNGPVLTLPHLTFARTHGPTSRFSPELLPDAEIGADGFYDFWFTNENDAPVEVFLTKVSCNRCVSVKIGLAPEGVRMTDPEKPPQPGPDVGWTKMESEELKHDSPGFTVPPKAAGWVRLGWTADEAGQKLLVAQLRTTSPVGSAPPIALGYGAVFIDPVRVLPEKKELALDTLSAGDDQPRTAVFTVYSSTRSHFDLTPGKTDNPFVTCGTPEPLTEKERQELEKQNSRDVKCGYRVPVTVRERVTVGKETREHDWGPFRTTVALKTDAQSENIGLTVRGTVQGDVSVLSDTAKDHIDLGAYPQSSGTTKTVTVEARRPDVSLSLDSKPDFLGAELQEDSPQGEPHKTRTWTLTVTVKPGAKGAGQFGHPGDPDQDGSVIYLRAKDRRVRIPVSGTVLPK